MARGYLLACCLAALLVLARPAPSFAQDPASAPIEALIATIGDQHPSAYFILAARLYETGQRDEAVRWLYVAQIRYRFHLAANPGLDPSGDPALFASLMETVGRPINEYAGGNVDGWLAGIDAALAWDAANGNGFTSKTAHAGALRKTRAGLAALRASLARRDPEASRAERLAEPLIRSAPPTPPPPDNPPPAGKSRRGCGRHRRCRPG